MKTASWASWFGYMMGNTPQNEDREEKKTGPATEF